METKKGKKKVWFEGQVQWKLDDVGTELYRYYHMNNYFEGFLSMDNMWLTIIWTRVSQSLLELFPLRGNMKRYRTNPKIKFSKFIQQDTKTLRERRGTRTIH